MSASFNHNTQGLRLPTINIPIFEGGYFKWPPFTDLFVGIFQNLTENQKLAHLHDRTKGEAKEIVSRFEIVDANFDLAWRKYENTRILAHQQIKKLFGMQVIQSESPKALRSIQSTINDSLSIFKSHNIDVTNWDPILNHLCSTKISKETLIAWEDSLTYHKTLPKWIQMDNFLSGRIEKLETVIDMRKPPQRDSHYSKSQSFYTQDSNNSNSKCPICSQQHFLWQCKHFQNLSPKDRSKVVMTNKYCLNCLSKGHFIS